MDWITYIFTEAHWAWWMSEVPTWMHVFAIIGGFWFYCEKVLFSIFNLLFRR